MDSRVIYDWTPYAIGGATRPDSFTAMEPAMQSGLYGLLSAADAQFGPGALQVYSGYRSPELQAQLFANAVQKYGSEAAARKWVAPPGSSQHNHGRAADLKFNGARLDQTPEVAAWVRQNAPQYGLATPMEWEPWQVELAGARQMQGPPDKGPVVIKDGQIISGQVQGQGLPSATVKEEFEIPEWATGLADVAQQYFAQPQMQVPQMAPRPVAQIQASGRDPLAAYRSIFEVI